jgi:hypothetical protein
MEKTETCPVCQKPEDQCVCCPECGHVCPLDLGEPYCPVCKPEPKKPGKEEK